MNVTQYVDIFFVWLKTTIDLPALLLIGMMVLFVYVLVQIQRNKDNKFDFADLFLDETGKASVARMMNLICGGVASWVLMYMVMHSQDGKVELGYYIAFMGIWSGQKVADKLIDAWSGRLAPTVERPRERCEEEGH
jgi:hypothetical protein